MPDQIGLNLKAVRIFIHASIWFAPLLGPFLVYLLIKDEDIQRLSLQAMVFHIVMWLLLGISALLIFILIGLVLFPIFGAIFLITPIVGIVYAIQGRYFSYPIIGGFIK